MTAPAGAVAPDRLVAGGFIPSGFTPRGGPPAGGTERAMKCDRCGKEVGVLINGWCVNCKPFRRCPKCGEGELKSAPKPSWMNRWRCDVCKKCVSR